MEQVRAQIGRWLLRESEAASALARLGLPEAARQAKRDAACLRGVLRLTGEARTAAPAPRRTATAEAEARRLYGESLRLRSEYEGYADDPEYGCVFAELAKRKTARCLALADWLGR